MSFKLVYSTSVIHLPRVHHLLSPANGNLFRVGLVHEGLVRCFDSVHGVLGSGHVDGQVVDARGTAHFEEAGGDAETEA